MSGLAEHAAALVGRRTVYTAPEDFGAAAFRYYARAVGDHNRLYTDADYARTHGYRDVVAPPTLVCETNQYADLPMDAEGYAGHTWRIEIPDTRTVRGGNSYVFHRPVHPDDRITATWEILDARVKTGRQGGEMLVVTSRATYTNQAGERLVENTETIIFVSLEASR
ncbi:MaoC family dehydratase N-terminal domain-containing protein [Nocardioides sp. LMS-CY]|uniref:FAS1-like dehydratase domain-containing protein n=1 Tax=Nocardioides sp. (strain LMS-CY) TaxID=2840457 RepID=UPI001C00664C|nr:MaoC family dehydratase N-terminal domain-containing protein [Nocardioides sp. LMS-CY]QWF23287.1 MaoC family dehydratase N-terminal domain-containing protein [Nocardioides sp. LMS-CY]